MDTFTIVLLVVTILLVIACIVLAVTKWKAWSETDRAAILSAMYAVAKTVYDALKDGKLEKGEISVLFNEIVGILAMMSQRHTDEVEKEFDNQRIAETTQ